MKKRRIMVVLIFMVLIMCIFPNIVKADMGPKPSITIKIKNLKTNNYLIDLLIYAPNVESYYPDSNFSNEGRTIETDEPGETDKNGITVHFDKIAEKRDISIEQAKQLYDIDYDGWISTGTRNSLLWGTCNGNSEHEHRFHYFGVPNRYKIILINNDTGETKVSDEIIREDFSSKVIIDYNDMHTNSKASLNVKNIIVVLLITIAVESIIALFMKYKKYLKVIVLTNLVTNILLQLLLNIILGNYFVKIILLEIVVIAAEYLIYKTSMKEEPTKKILIYTLIANIVTACLTFIIK